MSKSISCLVNSQELITRISEIKALYPTKLDKEIKAEIGAWQLTQGPNGTHDYPTVEQMQQYYKDNAIPETGVPIAEFEAQITNMSELDDFTNQTFNSSQERRDRVTLIANIFSDATTELYEEALEKNPSLKRESFILRHYQDIWEYTKSAMTPNPEHDDYTNEKLGVVQSCWDILKEEAFNIIKITEGVSMSIEEVEDQHDEDNQNIKDGWMIKARLLDIRETLSAQTRKILRQLPLYDRNGEQDVDDLGFPKYIDPEYAHISLLEEFSKITSPKQFNTALENYANKHPWAKAIINEFETDEAQPLPHIPQLRQKFYRDMHKEFVPYWIETNGKTKQVNKTPSIYYLFNSWRDNYEGGNILTDNSVYTKRSEIKQDKAELGFKKLNELSNKINQFKSVSDQIEFITTNPECINSIMELFNMIGIDVDIDLFEETIKTDPTTVVSNLLTQLTIIYNGIKRGDHIKKDGTTKDLIEAFKSAYESIARTLNIIPKGSTLAFFREAGNNYPSYSLPSYIGKFIANIHNLTGQSLEDFMYKEFGQYRQFYFNERYSMDWLRKLNDPTEGQDYRNKFDRKVVLHSDKTELHDWTLQKYLKVMLDEFFSGGKKTGWYALPLLADAPSAEFIKFIKYTSGDRKDADDNDLPVSEIILPLLADTVLMEYNRIRVVQARANTPGVYKIANFDIGSKTGANNFKFFPYLNNLVLENGSSFIDELSKRIKDKNDYREFIADTLRPIFENNFQIWKSQLGEDSLQTYKNEQLQEFFYNYAHAYTQMVQLFTTDLGYYKDITDFQKRFKEVYAQTQKLYTPATLDGKIHDKEYTIYLKDEVNQSSVYQEIQEVINNSIKSGLLDKNVAKDILSAFKEVNITDAQAFRSLKSYRNVMHMAGDWTDEHEEAYQNITNGKYDKKYVNIVWQTIKPFVYTQTSVNSQITTKDGNPYGLLKVPTQHKNSEFLLLAMYQALGGPQYKSPKLRAINEFMDKHDIDVVQYESAVKAGCQGCIDLNGLTTYEDVTKALELAFNDGQPIPEIIHEIDYEDYGIQTATPEHLLDEEVLRGSQIQKLSIGNLPDSMFSKDHPVRIGTKKYTDKQSFVNDYLALLGENPLQDFSKVFELFGSRENLVREVQKEMSKSSRYTDEMKKAFTIREDGTWTIPPHDPVQKERIENLVNSIVKNRIIKQKIKGGACIQVSCVGMDDKPQIRFADEDGNIIFTEREWNSGNVSNEQAELLDLYKSDYDSYEEYRNSRTATRVAYYEAYLPAWSKEFFGLLSNGTNELDINRLPDELRKIIGYRIPTEAKYSMQPIYVKGFLPQQNGSAIMLPEEITTTVGSDFDVDKVYLMIPEFNINENENKWSSNKITKIASSMDTWEGRNNMMIDMLWAILTHPDTANQNLTPGGFEEATRVGAICDILRFADAKSLGLSISDILNLSKKDAEALATQVRPILDPLVSTTQAYFNTQNSVGGRQIGIYASSTPLHALGQYCDTHLQKPINIFGRIYQKLDNILDGTGQRTIASNMANFLAASVDNVKKPVLASLNQNGFTGDITNFLLRLGVPITDIGLFLNQPAIREITDIIAQGGPESRNPKGVIKSVIDKYKTNSTEFSNELFDEKSALEALGWGLLYNRQSNNQTNDDELRYFKLQNSVLALFKEIYETSEDLAKITRVSRFDTVNNAAGPTIADNIVKLFNLYTVAANQVSRVARDPATQEEVILPPKSKILTNMLDFGKLLNGKVDVDDIRNEAKNTKVPFLHIQTKCGICSTLQMFEQYFPQSTTFMIRLLKLLSNYTNNGSVSVNLANQFFNDMYIYYLSSNNTFNTGRELLNRNIIHDDELMYKDYLINKFPTDVEVFIEKYPELKNNDLVNALKVKHRNAKNPIDRIEYSNGGSLSSMQRDALSKDWGMLLMNSNPDIQQFGIDLFKYLALSGLTFSPKSPITFAPNVLRLAIPGYIDTINKLFDADIDISPYIKQFVLNHLQDTSSLSTDISDLTIAKQFNKDVVTLGAVIDDITPFVKVQDPITKVNTFYELTDPDTGTFVKVKPLGVKYGPKEYYFGEEVDTFVSVIGRTISKLERSQVEPAIVEGDDDFNEENPQQDSTVKYDETEWGESIPAEFTYPYTATRKPDANNNNTCE